jgi:hypothetical protein
MFNANQTHRPKSTNRPKAKMQTLGFDYSVGDRIVFATRFTMTKDGKEAPSSLTYKFAVVKYMGYDFDMFEVIQAPKKLFYAQDTTIMYESKFTYEPDWTSPHYSFVTRKIIACEAFDPAKIYVGHFVL